MIVLLGWLLSALLALAVLAAVVRRRGREATDAARHTTARIERRREAVRAELAELRRTLELADPEAARHAPPAPSNTPPR